MPTMAYSELTLGPKNAKRTAKAIHSRESMHTIKMESAKLEFEDYKKWQGPLYHMLIEDGPTK
jgi:hypothetical protein